MLLAALPSTPVQLAHACYRFAFEIVIPASWGDELVASAVLEDLRHRNRDPVIQCTCPLVSERLLANGQHLMRSMVQTASPPVAASRYARHAMSPRAIHVTYIGACPGARHPAVDERIMPDEFIRMLDEQDIAIADMPTVFDSVLPPDRRRFVSLPGGCPTQEALWQASDGRMLREVTQPTFSTDLAQTLVWREYVMVDVAPSLGCACAGGFSRLGARFGRVAVTALEPPRATHPVVSYQPEFTAPTVEEPTVPLRRNGDTPSEQASEAPESSEASQSDSLLADATSEAVGNEAMSTSKVRARSPSSGPLPRAYLAKRRHLSSATRDSAATAEMQPAEPATHETEPVFESAPVPNEYVEAIEQAPSQTPNEDVLQQRLELDDFPAWPTEPAYFTVASAEPADVPGASAEPAAPAVVDTAAPEIPITSGEAAEVPLSIAVHFEPEATAAAETASAQTTPHPTSGLAVDVSMHIAASPPIQSEEPTPALQSRTSDARETEDWGPPVAVAVEEEPDSFAAPGGPLRVEVEIYEEIVVVPAAVAPDVVVSEKPIELLEEVRAEAAQPGSAWGDLLIALWLVLVASAVIASLVWRR